MVTQILTLIKNILLTWFATPIGKSRNVLLAERTALNILSRASGIASAARRILEIKNATKWGGIIAGTRKITPGFGKVEKYALLVGGKIYWIFSTLLCV